jgi:hypothetical protein
MLGFGFKLGKKILKATSEALSFFTYFRPDGSSLYKRPDGSDYIRP